MLVYLPLQTSIYLFIHHYNINQYYCKKQVIFRLTLHHAAFASFQFSWLPDTHCPAEIQILFWIHVMAIGERIHFSRILREMAQKYLNMIASFPEQSFDVHLALKTKVAHELLPGKNRQTSYLSKKSTETNTTSSITTTFYYWIRYIFLYDFDCYKNCTHCKHIILFFNQSHIYQFL